jgi:uncharacterized protein
LRLENAFEVPVPPERAWQFLLDVPRVVPCMPGAELTETVDETYWKATMQVRLGPIALTFLADVAREEADNAAQRIVLTTRAREQRGRGGATATIASTLERTADGTRVAIVTDLQLSGTAAQVGAPVVKDVATQLTKDFAACLRRQLGEQAAGAAPETAAPSPARPLSGLRLLLRALLARLRRP